MALEVGLEAQAVLQQLDDPFALERGPRRVQVRLVLEGLDEGLERRKELVASERREARLPARLVDQLGDAREAPGPGRRRAIHGRTQWTSPSSSPPSAISVVP